ncbi:MAG: hypothetical protein CMN73_05645 [Sphingomonas sp.]|nr:hypothetical protein [Sphingomonas sp.]
MAALLVQPQEDGRLAQPGQAWPRLVVASGAVSEVQQPALTLRSPPEQHEVSMADILEHPEAVNPYELIEPITTLFRRGDRLQASFLFYFWQIRSAPWARLGRPDGERALRGAINATLGPEINGWVGSDPQAWLALVYRAIAFEKRVPLYSGRPEGVSPDKWEEVVEAERARYAEGFEEARPILENGEEYARKRAGAGLYVGPWQEPGAPLPEHWR